ncbi:LacI family DNA-binding transcriptional regulator [Yunchengibacter salinarum]|uniref:LacI family DNA-binding transcriptional regulator n=1 Tax=Yunchengibacter salinarum TaxID=3133399 RepID=UPI0035B5FE87
MATIYAVSRLAGVSLATVSRVINGNVRVKAETRKKVEDAIKALDYHPNSAAKSLASNRSDSIGLLVSELHGPFFGGLMSVIEKDLREAGKHVIITAGHANARSEEKGIDFLINRNCDGLILHCEDLSDLKLLQLSEKDVPLILVNRYVEDLKDGCIDLDNREGGRLACQHLIDQGHRRIACISGPKWKRDAMNRLKGHRGALEQAGIPWQPALCAEGTYREESGYDCMLRLLDSGQPMTAVACGNDEMAVGAMKALRERGIQIPQDISVVGFDDVVFATLAVPPLTTVHFPVDDMGHLAADLILSKCYGEERDIGALRFKPRLVVRNSVAPPAA